MKKKYIPIYKTKETTFIRYSAFSTIQNGKPSQKYKTARQTQRILDNLNSIRHPQNFTVVDFVLAKKDPKLFARNKKLKNYVI